ncbi:hypothetical protein PHYSODRAFT_295534 [Phytophthora sojae]|uniref:Uncharacterized protein n=1 Tax=Phytophthora sojae (strain P6497) TaxID=1094619 RepID=G4YRU5_PHYSP|nr:hypothetical protein PHYSODRAFT_295534 [Phytophthora sojae]EGZ22922.1 hypothetical protein PHYSODRAFT_295534 [Phytophthora sojae]|eukprot:XP_009518210.1 hypothetical protein PHYSODRAFT_295534 [Phytophthora sojae]
MAVCVCFGWTLWLILLNVAPDDTVNRVMNTETFDYGSFWLMVNPSEALVAVATVGMSVVALGYLGVLVKVVTRFHRRKNAFLIHQASSKRGRAQSDTSDRHLSSKMAITTKKFAKSLIQDESPARKRIKLLMKFGDLALETLLLYQMLEAGSPLVLIGIFTFIAASNALACAAMMFVPFDFLIIIGCPMLVVVYCLSAFTFDHAKFAINLEVFPAGWFEQGANVIADAEQTAVIYESLKSLRIMTALSFFTRIGVNITLCLRLWQVVDLIHNPNKQHSSVYPKRHRLGAAFLVIYAAMLVIFVEESVRTSSLACRPHPECVVSARRWTILEDGSLSQCPCLMLIDRDIAPKTYADWENPVNVTNKVAQLAVKGELQTVQLTNRYLAVFPEELRRCKNLRHLSLEYTHTQTFPSWMKEFSKLEFMWVWCFLKISKYVLSTLMILWYIRHVDSKFTSPMVALPDDMFEDMSSLTFIHFAAFIPMAKLPSFDGLTNLKSLTLAVFLLLDEVPSFDKLENLERLVLASMPGMNSLPDVSHAGGPTHSGTHGALQWDHVEAVRLLKRCATTPDSWASPARRMFIRSR